KGRSAPPEAGEAAGKPAAPERRRVAACTSVSCRLWRAWPPAAGSMAFMDVASHADPDAFPLLPQRPDDPRFRPGKGAHAPGTRGARGQRARAHLAAVAVRPRPG